MKQTPLKRHTPLGRGKKRGPSSELREKMVAFKMAVQLEPCATCGRWFGFGTWFFQHAHHVVYRQHLPVEYHWDPRNALSVCDECHPRHHNASRRIPLSALTEDNWTFAREVLSEAADDYLKRRYSGG